VAIEARDLERRLVGFAAGIAEEDFIQAGDARDAVGCGFLHRDLEQVGGMRDPACDAVVDGLGEPGMRIAERVDRDAGERV
jgi:hypothetical protein